MEKKGIPGRGTAGANIGRQEVAQCFQQLHQGHYYPIITLEAGSEET